MASDTMYHMIHFLCVCLYAWMGSWLQIFCYIAHLQLVLLFQSYRIVVKSWIVCSICVFYYCLCIVIFCCCVVFYVVACAALVVGSCTMTYVIFTTLVVES